MKVFLGLWMVFLFSACDLEFPKRPNPDLEDLDVGNQSDSKPIEGSVDARVDQTPESDIDVQEDVLTDLMDGSVPVWDASQFLDSSTRSMDSVAVADQGEDPDAALLPNPFYIDDDEDGFAEVDGDCNDRRSDIHPGVMELCDDGQDNDCNQLFDFEDPVCLALTDTVIRVTTRGAVPAMVLSVESYNRAQDIDGWQVFATEYHQRTVEVILPAITFPSNVFCGIRFNVTFYQNPDDVSPRDVIVGDPDRWLCEMNEEGMPFNDPYLSDPRIQINGEEYDIDRFIPLVVPDEPGCSMFFIVSDQGDCAL